MRISNGLMLLASAVCFSACVSNDSEIHPPVAETDLLIIRRADQILSSEEKWNRADDRILHPGATTFSLYTAVEEATLEVGGKFAHRSAAMQEVRFAVDEVAPNKDYDHRLMGFNNDPGTTFADIKHVIALSEAGLVAKLEHEK